MAKSETQNSIQLVTKDTEFFKTIKRASEDVKKWPDWKKGEYVTVSFYNERDKK